MTEGHAECFVAMGTRVELHAFGPCDPQALRLARHEVERVDDALTIHRPSPTVTLNEALSVASGAAVDDPILLAALIETRVLMRMTDGLFDATVRQGAPRGAWDLDIARGRVEAEGPLAFDFGGMGKGLALDAAAASLRAGGVQSGLLSAGESSILAIGQHPLGGPWPIGVPHPFAPGTFLAELDLVDEALSVSATVDAAAPCRQPTLRSDNGAPVTAPLTAVAVAAQGARAEGLSTALLAASPEERDRLAQRHSGRMLCFRYEGRDAITLAITGELACNV
ncbi:FAD:protein FMN transferase [Sphingobium algorifonticola]|uniref:FAD:protein FMN transferase n=1 Tax=Sphingobium algorifonticola TaxID=2008318 RepID=A0A437J418_9SPHN|nr:FAD:protein FMN transferase [Sphingobium algorifonticola]RVT39416.1 FAD:protein FMN transferase [Sphingobium algorifonticola]